MNDLDRDRIILAILVEASKEDQDDEYKKQLQKVLDAAKKRYSSPKGRAQDLIDRLERMLKGS